MYKIYVVAEPLVNNAEHRRIQKFCKTLTEVSPCGVIWIILALILFWHLTSAGALNVHQNPLNQNKKIGFSKVAHSKCAPSAYQAPPGYYRAIWADNNLCSPGENNTYLLENPYKGRCLQALQCGEHISANDGSVVSMKTTIRATMSQAASTINHSKLLKTQTVKPTTTMLATTTTQHDSVTIANVKSNDTTSATPQFMESDKEQKETSNMDTMRIILLQLGSSSLSKRLLHRFKGWALKLAVVSVGFLAAMGISLMCALLFMRCQEARSPQG